MLELAVSGGRQLFKIFLVDVAEAHDKEDCPGLSRAEECFFRVDTSDGVWTAGEQHYGLVLQGRQDCHPDTAVYRVVKRGTALGGVERVDRLSGQVLVRGEVLHLTDFVRECQDSDLITRTELIDERQARFLRLFQRLALHHLAGVKRQHGRDTDLGAGRLASVGDRDWRAPEGGREIFRRKPRYRLLGGIHDSRVHAHGRPLVRIN